MPDPSPPISRALVSVSDKTGLVEFSRRLAARGVEILSTGGTRRHLLQADVDAGEVSEYTGFPEMMDGRLKTLHPKVAGGVLCRRDNQQDLASAREHGIIPFELVVVNLYPFEQTVARSGVTPAEAIEQIDIGGPTLVRAAAKNHAFVTVATSPEQYDAIAEQIEAGGATTFELRQQLAASAFARTAAYDAAIATYLEGACSQQSRDLPPALRLSLTRRNVLRYGENPHQRAALYVEPNSDPGSLVSATQLNGKELSYNNLLDLDAAQAVARSLPECGVAVVKHNNPCGAASAGTVADAARRAWEGDPVSAFGSVLGFNRPVDRDAAMYLTEPERFVEAIVAPGFEEDALEVFTTRPKWKASVRLLSLGGSTAPTLRPELRRISGGLLLQDADGEPDEPASWQVVTREAPSEPLRRDLEFAWAVCRHVKSNAIVLARERALVGVGAGQMSRVDSVEIAIRKADRRARGAVLASDAFFPFADSIRAAASAGVAAVIQPGGSRRDKEVIAACDEHGLPMLFTGRRHFRH